MSKKNYEVYNDMVEKSIRDKVEKLCKKNEDDLYLYKELNLKSLEESNL